MLTSTNSMDRGEYTKHTLPALVLSNTKGNFGSILCPQVWDRTRSFWKVPGTLTTEPCSRWITSTLSLTYKRRSGLPGYKIRPRIAFVKQL